MGEPTVGATATPQGHLIVRPRAALVRSTALSLVFSAVPLVVALLWVSLPLHLVAVVVTLVLVLAVAAVVVLLRFRTAYAGVGPQHVEFRGVLGRRVRIDRAQVHQVVLATTHGPVVDRTTRELLALSASGRGLFRMRSVMWDDDAIRLVAEALDARVTEIRRPLPAREFLRRYPTGRAWHERPLGVVVLGLGGLVVAAIVAVAGHVLLG